MSEAFFEGSIIVLLILAAGVWCWATTPPGDGRMPLDDNDMRDK